MSDDQNPSEQSPWAYPSWQAPVTPASEAPAERPVASWSAPLSYQEPGYQEPVAATAGPAASARSHRKVAPAALLALALFSGAVGSLVTHEVWHPGSSSNTAASTPSTGTTTPSQTNPFGGTSGNSGSSGGSGSSGDGSTSGGSSSSGTGTTGTGPTDAAKIATNVDPGIVDINTTLGYANGEAAGTGMVLTSTGEILTNNHVIDGATSISVTDIGNGKTYTAKVVGYSKTADVAVLQLENASGLTTVKTNTSTLQVGAGVVGVGNAGGAGGTPSYAGGTVTALNQSITASDESDGTSEQLTGLIQTNADIQAGDSGGPLVNTSGEVVGMDTAASANTRFSSTSEGYAIPIATALSVAKQIESGSATSTIHIGATAMLGVDIQSASSSQNQFGGSTGSSSSGAVVEATISGQPAANAGLEQGDTITSLAGKSISSADDLSAEMLQLKPGQTVSLTYLDNAGSSQTVSVTLGTGPAQ